MSRVYQVHPALARFATYADAVEVEAGARTLHVSGQLGMLEDGTVPASFAEQCETAWRNLEATLDAAGLGLDDLAFLRIYLVDPDDVHAMREIKDRVLGARRVASTVMVLRALGHPDWKVEIEATAAR